MTYYEISFLSLFVFTFFFLFFFVFMFVYFREFVEEANKASMRINEYLHVR